MSSNTKTSQRALNTAQLHAIVENFSHSVVFLLNPSPANPYTGTAVLVRFRSQCYLVSALHNFDKDGNVDTIASAWTQTRFKFRDEGPLQFHEDDDRTLHILTIGIKLPLDSVPIIDKAQDLIAVRVNETAFPSHVYPTNLDTHLFTDDIPDGTSLVTVGMPAAAGQKIKENATVFYPHTFYARYSADARVSLRYRDRSEDQFLYSYSPEDVIHPGGFSGAPVWANNDSPGTVWSPVPIMVGLALVYYEDVHLIGAAKMRHIVDLLKRDPLMDLDNGLMPRPE